MLRYALRLTAIFIIVQSLVLFPLAAPRRAEKPTPVETRQALEISHLFMQRMEETGDLQRVIDELFVEDFIWRYIHEQQREMAEPNSSATVLFAPGLSCKKDLLTQATTQDWQRLYVATYNFFYHLMVISLNQTANDLLNDKEPAEEVFEKLLPSNVTLLFDNHPVLKNFIEAKGKSKAIETVEDMRGVSETLEEGLRLLLEGQDNHIVKPNEETKKLFEKLRQTEVAEPMLEIAEQESFGYPTGTRMLLVLTPIFFGLNLVEVNGKQKIVWAELFAGD